MEHPINIKIDHAHATANSRQGQGSGREMDSQTYLVKLLICRTITSINNYYHVLIGQFTNGNNNIRKSLIAIPITVLNFEIAHCILKIIKAISSYL